MAFGVKTFQCTATVLLLCLLLHSPAALSKIVPRFPVSRVPRERLTEIASNNGETNNIPYEIRNFTQILDHFNFNPESEQTFQQRYLINDTHWGGAEKNAPIFVYLGGEGDIVIYAQSTGFLLDIAPQFKALVFFLEHRFYGMSFPFEADKEIVVSSTNSSTQGYLSSSQALADYATLILDLKRNLGAIDSPVVVFGGSYAGNLAAWMRLKYPHITIGALASSAPILMLDNITSPYNFFDTITKNFRDESENCYQVIKGSWDQLNAALNQAGGIELLQSKFNLCKNVTFEYSHLEMWFKTAYVWASQNDFPYPANGHYNLPGYPVKQMCKAIDNPVTGNDTFTKLYGAVNVFYNHTGNLSCFDVKYDSFDPLKIQEWQFQRCTEMVMIKGSSKESMFPEKSPGITPTQKCINGVLPRPHRITTEFGGFNMHRVLRRFGSNIIFSNGLRDPWSGQGVLTNISDSLVAIVAKEGAHHVDLRLSTKDDPDWLKEMREKEIGYIGQWLSQHYRDLTEISD